MRRRTELGDPGEVAVGSDPYGRLQPLTEEWLS